MSSLRFGRLNFKTKLSDFEGQSDKFEERKKKLLEVINYETNLNKLIMESGVDVPKENVDWHFAGVKSDNRYIYAKLGKEREEDRKYRDDEEEDYVYEELENADIARFLIDIKESIIVYEYRRNVGEKAPYRVIEAAFNEYHEEKDHLRINVLTDRKKFIKRLDSLKKIEHIELSNLEPTNPNSTDRSDKMDKFLKEGSVEKMDIDAEGEEEGIQLSNLPLIRSAFHLAEEGHGSAKVDGEDEEGNEKSFGTGDVPIKQERDIDPQSDERNRNKLKNAIEKALEIIKETGNEDV
jgi:hypothetical protein